MMQHLHQMYQQLNIQNKKMSQLEATIQQLQNEVNSLKERQTSNIEKIEYKFDQLKVERLEGTLNIGITPNNAGGSSVEDFSVNQHDLNVPPINQYEAKFFEDIQEQIHEYLHGECYRDIDLIEKQNNYQIDSHYRQYIIEDIRKQVDNRLRYYLNQMNLNNSSQDELVKIKDMALTKMKEDIHKTYEEFVRQLPRKES